MRTRVSRSLTMALRRSISLFTSCRNSMRRALSMSGWYTRDSISTFMAARGVFSSWEALATNWLRVSSRASSFSDMLLKAAARWRTSPAPFSGTRSLKLPLLMRWMTFVISETGRVSTLANRKPTATAARATSRKISSICLRKSNRPVIMSVTGEISISTPMTSSRDTSRAEQ